MRECKTDLYFVSNSVIYQRVFSILLIPALFEKFLFNIRYSLYITRHINTNSTNPRYYCILNNNDQKGRRRSFIDQWNTIR